LGLCIARLREGFDYAPILDEDPEELMKNGKLGITNWRNIAYAYMEITVSNYEFNLGGTKANDESIAVEESIESVNNQSVADVDTGNESTLSQEKSSEKKSISKTKTKKIKAAPAVIPQYM